MAHKAIFLDRDDTLIHDPGYISDPEQVKLIDGAAEAMVALRQLGYKLILVTNQSAIARGMITEDKLRAIHDRLEYLLAQKGASLDRIYFCPYHKDGKVKKYAQDHDWRKPNPGMLLAASKDMKIDLRQSWCIGDRASDIGAGQQAGCRTILLSATTPVPQKDDPGAKADFVAVNLREAVNIVKQERHQGKALPETTTPAQETSTSPAPKENSSESSPSQDKQPEPQKTSDSTPEKQAPTKGDQAKPSKRPARPSPMTPVNEPSTDELLKSILDQLRSMQRQEMFHEFSYVRFIAGIAQMVVLLCLVIAVWFLMSSGGSNQGVANALGFAGVLQVMALTFYLMDQKS